MEKKQRPKRSILWKIPKEELIEIVKQSSTLTQVLNKYGLDNKGGNHHTLKKRLIEDNIDYSHITLGCGHNKGKRFNKLDDIDINELFIENGTLTRKHSMKKLLAKIKGYKCESCGMTDTWNNKLITLQMDHINGINTDNRLDNLRFLCPNCHSQTHTYAGHSAKVSITKSKVVKSTCIDCGKEVGETSLRCLDCSLKQKEHSRKVERPPLGVLLEEIKTLGYRGTGHKYNVSDNCIKKWIVVYKRAELRAATTP